jgi:hypothetical protein
MARHLALGDPAVKMLYRIGKRRRIGTGDRFIGESRLVEGLDHCVGEARRVIVERHRGIAAVAGDMDVFDLVVEGQPVERQMRLEETAMPLRLDLGDDLLDRLGKAPVDPCRYFHDRHRLGALEDEEAHDPLHPGGAAFGVGRDDDVVAARSIVPPAPAVEDPGAILAGGGLDQHGPIHSRILPRRESAVLRGAIPQQADDFAPRHGLRATALENKAPLLWERQRGLGAQGAKYHRGVEARAGDLDPRLRHDGGGDD